MFTSRIGEQTLEESTEPQEFRRPARVGEQQCQNCRNQEYESGCRLDLEEACKGLRQPVGRLPWQAWAVVNHGPVLSTPRPFRPSADVGRLFGPGQQTRAPTAASLLSDEKGPSQLSWVRPSPARRQDDSARPSRFDLSFPRLALKRLSYRCPTCAARRWRKTHRLPHPHCPTAQAPSASALPMAWGCQSRYQGPQRTLRW